MAVGDGKGVKLEIRGTDVSVVEAEVFDDTDPHEVTMNDKAIRSGNIFFKRTSRT